MTDNLARTDYNVRNTEPIQELRIVERDNTEWIKVAEAAAIMRVSVSNVAYLCRKGRIRCQKWGNAWMVSKEDAENYERSNRNPDWLHDDSES